MADGGWNFSTLINSLDDKIASATPKVDFSIIGNLGDTYQKGFENQQARNQANAFKGGIPQNPDGSPNYSEMAKTLFQLGNVDKGVSLANAGTTQQLVRDQNQPPPQSPPSYAPAPSAPPQTGSTQPGPVVQSQPKVMGDAEGVANGTYDAPAAPGQRPPVQPDAPPNTTAPVQPRPVQTQRILPPGQPNQMGATNPTEPVAQAGRMQQVMERAFQGAAIAAQAGNKALSEALLAKAKAIDEQLKPTTEIKNYNLGRQPGETLPDYQSRVAQGEGYGKVQGEQFAKKYEAVTELGNKAFQELPQIGAIQKLMNDPNFYSGVGEKYNLTMKRIVAAVGGDPNSALPQEAFRKVISGSILNSLGILKGLGQIRVAEINLAKEASASSENTPAANRMLVEISKRTYERAAAVAELAQKYNNGKLDSGFDRVVTNYYKNNPLFTDKELSNPKVLSLPRFASPQEAMKAPKGTQFVDSTGTVRMVP